MKINSNINTYTYNNSVQKNVRPSFTAMFSKDILYSALTFVNNQAELDTFEKILKDTSKLGDRDTEINIKKYSGGEYAFIFTNPKLKRAKSAIELAEFKFMPQGKYGQSGFAFNAIKLATKEIIEAGERGLFTSYVGIVNKEPFEALYTLGEKLDLVSDHKTFKLFMDQAQKLDKKSSNLLSAEEEMKINNKLGELMDKYSPKDD